MTQAAHANLERCPLRDTEPHWAEKTSAWQCPASTICSWQAADSGTVSQVFIKEKGINPSGPAYGGVKVHHVCTHKAGVEQDQSHLEFPGHLLLH